MPWTAHQLHAELAAFYRQYRGVPAPANTFSESLWNKIEDTEAMERKRRSER